MENQPIPEGLEKYVSSERDVVPSWVKLMKIVGIPEDHIYRASDEDIDIVYSERQRRPNPNYVQGANDISKFIEVPVGRRTDDEITEGVARKAVNACIRGDWREAVRLTNLDRFYSKVQSPTIELSLEPLRGDYLSPDKTNELRAKTNALITEIAAAVAFEDEKTTEEEKDVLLAEINERVRRGVVEDLKATREIFGFIKNDFLNSMLVKRDHFISRMVEEGKFSAVRGVLHGAAEREKVRKMVSENEATREYQKQEDRIAEINSKLNWRQRISNKIRGV